MFVCRCHRAIESGTRLSSSASEARAGAVYIASDVGLAGSKANAARAAHAYRV